MAAEYLMHEDEIEAFNISQTAKIVSIRKKQMANKNTKKVQLHRLINALTTICIVLAIAGLFSAYVYKNSLVNEAKYDIFNLKAEIKSLNAEAEELSASIENQLELTNIEKIAVENLNMQYPSKEQMVYIESSYNYALAPVSLEAEPVAIAPVQENDASFTEFVTALFSRND